MANETDFNNLPKALELLSEMERHTVLIGALKQIDDNSIDFLQMLIGISETGANIKPVHGKYLTIPTPRAGKRKAREIDGLFFYTTKTGKSALARIEDDKLVVYFLLALQVRIPARHLITKTLRAIKGAVTNEAAMGVSRIIGGELNSWRPILEAVGKSTARLMKIEIARIDRPNNAPITVANKGFDNPLVATGAMARSISWVVI